jgi:diadenosine tetraphosphate (Ap4A) HIT family hydrolase
VLSGDECEICQLLRTEPPGGWVLRESGWAAAVFPGREVPGSLVVSLEEHIEGLVNLPPKAAETLGPVAVRLGEAVKGVTGAERVYLVALGETYPHFHYLLAARTPDRPDRLRAVGFLSATEEMRDVERSILIAGQVRDALRGSPAGPP